MNFFCPLQPDVDPAVRFWPTEQCLNITSSHALNSMFVRIVPKCHFRQLSTSCSAYSLYVEDGLAARHIKNDDDDLEDIELFILKRSLCAILAILSRHTLALSIGLRVGKIWTSYTPFTRWSWLDELALRAHDERSSSSFVNVCNITPFKWPDSQLIKPALRALALVMRSSSQLHRVNGVLWKPKVKLGFPLMNTLIRRKSEQWLGLHRPEDRRVQYEQQ